MILLGITVVEQPKTKASVSVLITALQLFLESKTGLSLSTLILIKSLHPVKAFSPIFITEDGINISVIPV